jgi:hypothetical protein
MTLTYVVEEVTEIDNYSPDDVEPLGTFETEGEAVAAARAHRIDAWRDSRYKVYVRITVQGWQA